MHAPPRLRGRPKPVCPPLNPPKFGCLVNLLTTFKRIYCGEYMKRPSLYLLLTSSHNQLLYLGPPISHPCRTTVPCCLQWVNDASSSSSNCRSSVPRLLKLVRSNQAAPSRSRIILKVLLAASLSDGAIRTGDRPIRSTRLN